MNNTIVDINKNVDDFVVQTKYSNGGLTIKNPNVATLGFPGYGFAAVIFLEVKIDGFVKRKNIHHEDHEMAQRTESLGA